MSFQHVSKDLLMLTMSFNQVHDYVSPTELPNRFQGDSGLEIRIYLEVLYTELLYGTSTYPFC